MSWLTQADVLSYQDTIFFQGRGEDAPFSWMIVAIAFANTP
jgi:hypothetical protein